MIWQTTAQAFWQSISSLKEVLESIGLKFENPTVSQVKFNLHIIYNEAGIN